MSDFEKIVVMIQMLLEDSTTPRMVREKLTRMVTYLEGDEADSQSKISTSLSELEDMSADVNIPPYVRTQLYGISSQLEAIGNE